MLSLLVAILAMFVAATLWLWGGDYLAALERSPYDYWLRVRHAPPVSSSLVLITRDHASEARFGTGWWDRAQLARMVSAIRHNQAPVVALDIPVGEPSPPARGGAASDALLLETTKTVGGIIYPLAVQLTSDPSPDAQSRLRRTVATPAGVPLLAHQTNAIGHTLVLSENDGVVRKLPLFVLVGDRPVPALSLAIVQSFLRVPTADIAITLGDSVTLHGAKFPDGRAANITIPVDGHAQAFIDYVATLTSPLPSRSFLQIWNLIEDGDNEKLREWVSGKIVLILSAPSAEVYVTPVDRSMPSGLVHANFLNTVMSQHWLRETPPVAQFLAGVLLGWLAAWILLSFRGWAAGLGVLGVGAGYVGLVFGAMPFTGTVLPVVLPVTTMFLASASAILWLQFRRGQQVRLLESNMVKVQQEFVAVRRALACQESHVEDLEEDLEAARVVVARSAGKERELLESTESLREDLAQAKAQEGGTRHRLQELEEELRGLRAATAESRPLRDAELEHLRHECEQMGILTREPAVLSAYRDVKKAARSALPVMLLGEPGTGKELFARAVHSLSPRTAHPFVSINMAALSPQLFESELFGHVKGSFTGAIADRKGYFELADRGTLFLDEIGDLPLEHQGKLLRVLQEKSFYRVGATRPTTVDVRVVAATNKDLLRGVSEGWFREDLYFRLKGLVLRLPPLRDRPRDIALLATRFIQDANAQGSRERIALSTEALQTLEGHRWKGNIRELQHCLEQAIALADSKVITSKDLRLTAAPQAEAFSEAGIPDSEPKSDRAVLSCLREHEFDMQASARALGWDRSTVTQRLKGLGFRALVEAKGDHPKAALVLAGDAGLARTVELKLLEYYEHLIGVIKSFDTEKEAVAACRKRFKNLPERHFQFVEILVRQHFEQRN